MKAINAAASIALLLIINIISSKSKSILTTESTAQNLTTTGYKISNAISGPLTDENLPSYFKYPYFISGLDYENRPIIIQPFGKWNTVEVVKRGEAGKKEFLDFTQHMFDLIAEVGNQTSKLGSNGTFIADEVVVLDNYDGFKLDQIFSVEASEFTMKSLDRYNKIQDIVAYGFFVHVDSLAEGIIRLMKPLYNGAMQRIEIFGTQKQRWVPQLLKKIPRDQLPPEFGGPQDWKPLAVGSPNGWVYF